GGDFSPASKARDTSVGDSSAPHGTAIGRGRDHQDGGPGNDLVVGDALGLTSAVGRGSDNLEGEAGADLIVGDADATGAGAQAAGAAGDHFFGDKGDDHIVGDSYA